MAQVDDSIEKESPSKKILKQIELTKKPNWPVGQKGGFQVNASQDLD